MSKILIAEDEAVLREAYATILIHSGYEVLEATNGKDVLKILEETEPDLLILDMLMPILSGSELLHKFRLKENHPKLKILAFTNLSDQEIIKELRLYGVDRYLLKSSIMPHELIANIKKLLRQK
jgi:DNA-binding response OmpR family regulator